MKDKASSERPEHLAAPATFRRFQKLTKALLGVSKAEYDQKRAEYDRQAREKREEPR